MRANEIKSRLEAEQLLENQRQSEAQQRESLLSAQRTIDIAQSRERTADFLSRARLFGPGPDTLFMKDPEDQSGLVLYNKDYRYRGWVTRDPRGGYDEPYFSGYIVLEDGNTHTWDTSVVIDGKILYESYYHNQIVEAAYSGDIGLTLLADVLAKLELGIPPVRHR